MPLESLQNGRYVPVRQLGSGSMGEVYLVNDTVIDRKVAIKIMRADPPGYPDTEALADAVKLFKREAQAIARLEHPNILPLYDFGEEKREHTLFTYMVMPYCPEGSLTNWLQHHYPHDPLPIEETAYFIEQAALALQYAHDHSVIHQDVKPSNFLLRAHTSEQKLPDLLLADFGIARMSTGTTVNTTHFGPRGTPRYMPPEQWEGKPVAASDQYALAVTAYQLLTSTFPFQGEQMHQVMYQHFFTTPKSPAQLNPRIPTTLEAIIMRGMAKKAEERFPSVRDFAQAFRQALSPSGSITFSTTGPTQEIEAAAPTPQTPSPALQSPAITPPPPLQNPAMHNSARPISSYPGIPLSPPLGPAPHNQQMPPQAVQKLVQPISSYPGIPPSPPQIMASSPSEAAAPTFPQVAQPVQYTPPLSGPTTPWQGVPPSHSQDPGPAISRDKKPSGGNVALLISLVLLALLGGSGLSYYFILAKTHGPTPTPTPGGRTPQVVTNDNPYVADMTNLRYSDPLTQPGLWQNEADNGKTNGFCLFQLNAYHASSNVGGTYTLCPIGDQPVVSDLTFEVQVQILHGDCGGILFRGDFQTGNFYYFPICSDGRHYLYAYSNFVQPNQLATQPDQFPALLANPQATISLAVVAQSSTLTLYVNHQKVDQVNDATYSSGQISLFAHDLQKPTEVVYTNARLWTP